MILLVIKKKKKFCLHVKKTEMDRGYNKSLKIFFLSYVPNMWADLSVHTSGSRPLLHQPPGLFSQPVPQRTQKCMHTSTHFHFLHHLQYSLLIPSFPWSFDWKVLLCAVVTFAHRSAGYTLLNPKELCVSHSPLWVSTQGLHRGQRC